MLCGLCGVVITILINMRYTINLILIIALFAIVACTDNNRSHTGKDVTGVVYSAIKAHDKERALALTDSMERAGAITAPQADLLRGNMALGKVFNLSPCKNEDYTTTTII